MTGSELIDGIWYTIARNRMTYNEQGKRTSLENLAGQVTTTAWDGWFVTYNGENRPILWENVSTNSPTHNSSTPTLLSMSYDRMGRRVTKNNQRFVYDGYLQIADNNGNAYVWDPTEPVATRPLVWNYSTSQPFNLLTCHYTHDGNKNVSEIVSHSGGDDTHYEYSPFGRVSAQSGAVADVNPWRFSCEFSDDELDVVYYNYRFYDSMRGTWVRRDPVADIMAASTEADELLRRSWGFDWDCRGSSDLYEGEDGTTEISDMFKGVRFCKQCKIVVAQCWTANVISLKKRIEAISGCSVTLTWGNGNILSDAMFK